MIVGIQVIGLLFGLIMLYLTFLYYKKKAYTGNSFIVWSFIWICFILIVIFPEQIYGIMETLEIKRTVDFFVISGFLFFSVIIFYLYIITKKNQKMIEDIVRKVAIKRAK